MDFPLVWKVKLTKSGDRLDKNMREKIGKAAR